MISIQSVFAPLARTAASIGIQKVPSYHLNPLDHFLLESSHQAFLAVSLLEHGLPADMGLQEPPKKRQEVLFYNCEDVHLEGGLLFGEAIDTIWRTEDDHLHPQALQALPLPLAYLNLIEEDGQRKDAQIGEEVEAEQRWLLFLFVEVPDPPAQLDDDQLIFLMLLNLSIQILAWVFRGELLGFCEFIADLGIPAILIQKLFATVGLKEGMMRLGLVSVHG